MLKPLTLIASTLVTFSWLAIGTAADLAQLNRKIEKEPEYQHQPRYCLLVFGPKAETRVWLVEDGDTLYVDRNANGDLTEEGEALQPTDKRKLSNYRDAKYETIEIVPANGQAKHTDLMISRYRSGKKGMKYVIKVKVDGKLQQMAGWREIFSNSPKTAHVFHFGGKLAPRPLREKKLSLTEKKQELHLCWYTPGLGKNVRTMLGYEAVPEKITPVAEIQWPGKEGKESVRTTVQLVHRC